MTLSREQWNSWVEAAPNHAFLHSWEWGQLQERLGVPFRRLIVEDSGGAKAVALVIQRTLPLSRSWLYLPRGPVFKADLTAVDRESAWQELRSKLAAMAEETRALFIRLDPAWPESAAQELTAQGFTKAEREVQPRHTSIIALTNSEEELLAQMHHKTRYNLRLAERRGVTVRFGQTAEDVETFLQLSRDVASRGEFHFHPDEYYRAMREVLAPAGMFAVGIAEHGGQALAAHLLISFGKTMTYAHGASSSQMRELMAPHLLQWESMKHARTQGNTAYDLFGVAPPQASVDHPWRGITRFKDGFGGQRQEYVGTYDDIIDRSGYVGFTIVRRLRKLWR